jgi:superfamily II DNA/RNA helicase
MSQQSFADLGVSRAVAGALAERGITEPFAIQQLVIADILAGHDVLAKSPTGSGKTIAFGAPIADRIEANDRRPAALVLAPTRELASQIVEDIRPLAHARALRIAAVYGGVGIVKQAREAARAHIVVATPGRLEDLLERGDLTLDRVRILVLDEADRMLDMGFKPQVDRIVRRLPRNRQTMFFSATLDGEVGELAHAYTSSASRFEAEGPDDPADGVTEHHYVSVSPHGKVDTLVDHLRDKEGLILVFVRTKRGADRLVERLADRGVKAKPLHGGLSQRARERALDGFERGTVRILVATDVASRGLDIAGVEHVINFDPPEEEKAYLHRTGRTGRAGRSGVATTFVLPDQQTEASRVASRLGHRERFEETGMTAARPRLVYTSRRGRRSKW